MNIQLLLLIAAGSTAGLFGGYIGNRLADAVHTESEVLRNGGADEQHWTAVNTQYLSQTMSYWPKSAAQQAEENRIEAAQELAKLIDGDPASRAAFNALRDARETAKDKCMNAERELARMISNDPATYAKFGEVDLCNEGDAQ